MILTCHGIAGAGCDVQGGSSKEDDVLRKAWQQVQLSSCHGIPSFTTISSLSALASPPGLFLNQVEQIRNLTLVVTNK
jgi:hypothetical protein